MSASWSDLAEEEDDSPITVPWGDSGAGGATAPTTPTNKQQPQQQYFTPQPRKDERGDRDRERDNRQVRSADHPPPRRDAVPYHGGRGGHRGGYDNRGGGHGGHDNRGGGYGGHDNRGGGYGGHDNRGREDSFDRGQGRGRGAVNRDQQQWQHDNYRDSPPGRDFHHRDSHHRDTHGRDSNNDTKNNRDNRDRGEGRDHRDNRDNRDARENRDNRDNRDNRNNRDNRDARENIKDNRGDAREHIRDARDNIRSNKDVEGGRGRGIRDSRDPRDPREGRDTRDRDWDTRGGGRDGDTRGRGDNVRVPARLAGRLGSPAGPASPSSPSSPSRPSNRNEREIAPKERMFGYSKQGGDDYDGDEHDDDGDAKGDDDNIVISLAGGIRNIQVSSPRTPNDSPHNRRDNPPSRDNSPYRPPASRHNQDTPPSSRHNPASPLHRDPPSHQTPTRDVPQNNSRNTPQRDTPTNRPTPTKTETTPNRLTTTETTTPTLQQPTSANTPPTSAGKRRAKFAKADMPGRQDGEEEDDDEEWDGEEEEWDESDPAPIVGTCQVFEKPYFRLTSRPSPENVRPQDILESWFAVLSRNYTRKTKTYEYVSDQLKSIRQDLMVQHISNPFVVEVYEFNAVIALENKDFPEFIVCVMRLKELYEGGIALDNMPEFVAYRILFDLMNYDFAGISQFLMTLPQILLKHPAIAHALETTRAVQAKNYIQFRKLYESAPNRGKLFMESMLAFIRGAIIQIVGKAYKSGEATVPIEFMQRQLILERTECVAYLQGCGLKLSSDLSSVLLSTAKE